MGGHLAGWCLDIPAEHTQWNDGCWQCKHVCVYENSEWSVSSFSHTRALCLGEKTPSLKREQGSKNSAPCIAVH